MTVYYKNYIWLFIVRTIYGCLLLKLYMAVSIIWGVPQFRADFIIRTLWVVVKILVPFWLLVIIRHLYLGEPKKRGDLFFQKGAIILITTHMAVSITWGLL